MNSNKLRRTKKKLKGDLKIVERCKDCNKQLKKYNPHHNLCQECWEEKQIERGNFALMGGVR